MGKRKRLKQLKKAKKLQYRLDSLYDKIDKDYNPLHIEEEYYPEELKKWRAAGAKISISEYNKIKEQLRKDGKE